jgi:biopolymer transport protein ExbD
MTTRPLDLASKLRPEPRNFDALFYVNAGLIVLFFSLAGSPFVLAPGVRLPRIHGAAAGASMTTHRVRVEPSGLIVIPDGPADMARLREWLKEEAKKPGQHTLLVTADVRVPSGEVAEICNAAYDAGFDVQQTADEAAEPAGGR